MCCLTNKLHKWRDHYKLQSLSSLAVKDVLSSKLASHHFAIQNSVKDVRLEDIFQPMHLHDFREPDYIGTSLLLKSSEFSYEDRKFIDIFKRGTSKKHDHYLVSLSFRDLNLTSQETINPKTVGAQKKIYEGKQILLDFLKFRDNPLSSDYAKKSDASKPGRNWYIPHHGVYRKSKSGKTRNVFNCSAKF